MTFGITLKEGGKFKRLRIPPLTEVAAKDWLAYSVDNRIARTARIVRIGKRKIVGVLPKGVSGYYNKNKRKLREYRIKRKRARKLQSTYIEKQRFAADKIGEKLALRKSRRKVIKRKKLTRKPVKRKITPAQRRKMLANLKKARAARMRKLKKKR